MSKHTPGPWAVFNGTDVYPDDNDTGGTRHIADCAMYAAAIPDAEREANARLIAAAPMMLDEHIENVRVLTLLWSALQGRVDASKLAAIMRQIERSHAAIAAAEGRAE